MNTAKFLDSSVIICEYKWCHISSVHVLAHDVYDDISDYVKKKEGSAVAQSVERATPGEGVSGSIAAVAASSLLVGSVSV